VTIHHDGMPPVQLRSQRDVADRLSQIRHLHVDNQGWGDIGYHYIVDPQGRVWEGRPISWQGAHVANQNPGNVGVMCLGNFEVQAPTRAQVDALDAFVGSLSRRYSVSVSRIVTHQELAPTLCPGRNLQRHMDSTRASGGRIASLAIA
jgi:N-acetyl-anhydromuramyl-L-alanine amidase AmpD